MSASDFADVPKGPLSGPFSPAAEKTRAEKADRSPAELREFVNVDPLGTEFVNVDALGIFYDSPTVTQVLEEFDFPCCRVAFSVHATDDPKVWRKQWTLHPSHIDPLPAPASANDGKIPSLASPPTERDKGPHDDEDEDDCKQLLSEMRANSSVRKWVPKTHRGVETGLQRVARRLNTYTARGYSGAIANKCPCTHTFPTPDRRVDLAAGGTDLPEAVEDDNVEH